MSNLNVFPTVLDLNIYPYIAKQQNGAMNFSLVSCFFLHYLRLHFETMPTHRVISCAFSVRDIT